MAISLKESIIVGFSDFWSRKIRSFVTIFGIILGTMSIIVVLSVVKGINKKTLDWMMERGGMNKITIRKNWEYNKETSQKSYFTFKEYNLIRSLLPEVVSFNPQIRKHFRISSGSEKFSGRVSGVIPDFVSVEEWNVSEGRFISDFDVNQSSDVIVIGTQVREELFGNKNPIGSFITVHNRRLQVIGIMDYKFIQGDFLQDNALAYMNRRSFIPLSTMIHKVTNDDVIENLSIKAASPEQAPELREKIEAIVLNLRYGEPVFRIESAQENAQDMVKEQATFRMIFFLISMISLLIGGIVIMNIMLASIQERTREIGIRITVGARRRDIFMQFLVQTVLVTTIGGIFGITSGLLILDIVGKYLEFELVAGYRMIFIALLVSAGVGLIFGISPAIKASRLNPVEALRYE